MNSEISKTSHLLHTRISGSTHGRRRHLPRILCDTLGPHWMGEKAGGRGGATRNECLCWRRRPPIRRVCSAAHARASARRQFPIGRIVLSAVLMHHLRAHNASQFDFIGKWVAGERTQPPSPQFPAAPTHAHERHHGTRSMAPASIQLSERVCKFEERIYWSFACVNAPDRTQLVHKDLNQSLLETTKNTLEWSLIAHIVIVAPKTLALCIALAPL